MLSYERQNQILELLREQRCATVDYLSEKLFASGATIRRDLAEMNRRGLIARVRGGAAVLDGANQDTPLLVRAQKNMEQKERIAQLALRFVRDSSTLFMDSSSTVTALARKLSGLRDLSIVTNGIATMNVLNELTSAKVILCGGVIRNNSSLVGPHALETLESFRADLLFFSCCGLSRGTGATEAEEDNTAVKHAMLQNAKKRILLCDSTKFEQEFFCKSCALEQIDVIVTDRRPAPDFCENLPCELLFPSNA